MYDGPFNEPAGFGIPELFFLSLSHQIGHKCRTKHVDCVTGEKDGLGGEGDIMIIGT